MAAFCCGLVSLCESIPGTNGPVRVRIGMHCGPVTAGVIGHARRFYRVFGDTVSVTRYLLMTIGIG